MRIDIGKIDLERFHVNARTIEGLGDFLLVVPHKAMWDWEAGEEHLRSLLCRPDGTVVSAGFPKFYNHGENRIADASVSHGLRNGLVTFTEKADGSLIIRSVIDGKVHFRTRGSELIASDMREDVETLIRESYPRLLDPNFNIASSSLLMEYVGPKNQIVVKYDRPMLYGLGWSDWSHGNLQVYRLSQEDHDHLGLERLRIIDVPTDIVALKETVGAFDGAEGIVTWTREVATNGSYSLCKFKSGWYLRLHSLRSQATPRYIREYCYLNGIRTLDDLKASLLGEGFDWEVVSYIGPLFDEFRAHVDDVEARTRAVDRAMQDAGLWTLPTRKDIALKAKELAAIHGQEFFGYMMMTVTGKPDEAIDAIDSMKLDMPVTALRMLKKQGLPKLDEKVPELD